LHDLAVGANDFDDSVFDLCGFFFGGRFFSIDCGRVVGLFFFDVFGDTDFFAVLVQ